MLKARRPVRHPREPRGAILIICLMLMLITAILAGIILFLSRTEATITASTRGSIQAANAAEYGIEFAINSLNQSAPSAFPTVVLTPGPYGMQATAGLRDGSGATPQPQGFGPCPPGFPIGNCGLYPFTATGWAQGWLAPRASTQIQTVQSIWTACVQYSC